MSDEQKCRCRVQEAISLQLSALSEKNLFAES